MDSCTVRENCQNYNLGRDQCWMCEEHKLYIPEDKRIKSPSQIKKKAEKKAEKKLKKESTAHQRGKRAKKKGYEGEREIVLLLEKYNIEAKRVPLSGALKGSLSGDVNCVIDGKEKKIESKRRKDGFKELYKFMEQDGCNYIFMRADRKDWIVAMSFDEWLDLVKEVE